MCYVCLREEIDKGRAVEKVKKATSRKRGREREIERDTEIGREKRERK